MSMVSPLQTENVAPQRGATSRTSLDKKTGYEIRKRAEHLNLGRSTFSTELSADATHFRRNGSFKG